MNICNCSSEREEEVGQAIPEGYGRRASDRQQLLRRKQRGVRIRVLNACAILVASILALVALVTIEHVFESELRSEQLNATYNACSAAARDLQDASDHLTTQVRMFVVTGNREYMDSYLRELEVEDRRGHAVTTLESHLGADAPAFVDLKGALGLSDELAMRELYAMRLMVDAIDLADVPEKIEEVTLDEADAALSPEEKRSRAEEIVLGDEYVTTKSQISDSVSACSEVLLQQLDADVDNGNAEMRFRLNGMRAITIALVVIVSLVIAATITLILWPLAAYTSQIAQDEPLVPKGASELRYLADAYNAIYMENRERTMHLQYAVERDALTGLYNRGAYDALLEEHTDSIALLLVDVDYFKSVNDTYGHIVGDAVLRKTASAIEHCFRNTDYSCRVGGDEFAIIMTDMHPQLRSVVSEKVKQVARALQDTSDGLPSVTLSIGIAFSDSYEGQPDLYHAADQALYTVKESGRNGHAFYGDE